MEAPDSRESGTQLPRDGNIRPDRGEAARLRGGRGPQDRQQRDGNLRRTLRDRGRAEALHRHPRRHRRFADPGAVGRSVRLEARRRLPRLRARLARGHPARNRLASERPSRYVFGLREVLLPARRGGARRRAGVHGGGRHGKPARRRRHGASRASGHLCGRDRRPGRLHDRGRRPPEGDGRGEAGPRRLSALRRGHDPGRVDHRHDAPEPGIEGARADRLRVRDLRPHRGGHLELLYRRPGRPRRVHPLPPEDDAGTLPPPRARDRDGRRNGAQGERHRRDHSGNDPDLCR